MIYLDANATTPLGPEVLEAMLPWLRDGFANPSGSYAAAKAARRAVDRAREQVAELIGAQPGEIVFTGGGTESVNTALSSLDRLVGRGTAVVSAIEHSAVLRWVDDQSREVVRAPVGTDGRLSIDLFKRSIDSAAYISLMAVNNETGVIQPLPEVVNLARERGVPVHTDAIQAVGKIPLAVRELGVDLLSISAHKFHGPKGVGALFVREGLRFESLFKGGGQEQGRRSGTENVAGIVGMGVAADWVRMNSFDSVQRLRDQFETIVLNEIDGVSVNGSRDHRIANTSHLSFDGCDAAGLLILLDEAGVACSSGSACMTGRQMPSHVQLAMGIPEARAKSSLRFSFSRLNTMDEAVAAAGILKKAVEKLRRVQGLGVGPVVVYSP
jgi:cysteine desulfurase